jgi:hypothetical protein
VCRFHVATGWRCANKKSLTAPLLEHHATSGHHLQSFGFLLLDWLPWFLTKGKACCCIHHTLLLGFSNWPIIYSASSPTTCCVVPTSWKFTIQNHQINQAPTTAQLIRLHQCSSQSDLSLVRPIRGEGWFLKFWWWDTVHLWFLMMHTYVIYTCWKRLFVLFYNIYPNPLVYFHVTEV